MSNLVQKIANFAHKCFSKIDTTNDINLNISKLSDFVKTITLDDIDFKKDILSDDRKYDPEIHKAPVGYVCLCDSSILSMGIFIIRNGQKIPLHNHPNMYGVLKVIHGTAHIKSFSLLEKEKDTVIPDQVKQSIQEWEIPLSRPVYKHENQTVDVNSDPCIVTPSSQNIHEVEATHGTTAFLDILAPPYDDSRQCVYYKLIETKNETDDVLAINERSGKTYLKRSYQPPGFFCQPVEYNGPIIIPENEAENILL